MENKKRKMSLLSLEALDVKWQEFSRQREQTEGPDSVKHAAGPGETRPDSAKHADSVKHAAGATKAGEKADEKMTKADEKALKFKEYHWWQWEQEDAEAAAAIEVDNDGWDDDLCREEELPRDEDWWEEPEQEEDDDRGRPRRASFFSRFVAVNRVQS